MPSIFFKILEYGQGRIDFAVCSNLQELSAIMWMNYLSWYCSSLVLMSCWILSRCSSLISPIFSRKPSKWDCGNEFWCPCRILDLLNALDKFNKVTEFLVSKKNVSNFIQRIHKPWIFSMSWLIWGSTNISVFNSSCHLLLTLVSQSIT